MMTAVRTLSLVFFFFSFEISYGYQADTEKAEAKPNAVRSNQDLNIDGQDASIDDSQFIRETNERLLFLLQLKLKNVIMSLPLLSKETENPAELQKKINAHCRKRLEGLEKEKILLMYGAESDMGLEAVFNVKRFENLIPDIKEIFPSVSEMELRKALEGLQRQIAKRIWVKIISADLDCVLYLGDSKQPNVDNSISVFAEVNWDRIGVAENPFSSEIRKLALDRLSKDLGEFELSMVRKVWFINGLIEKDGD
jgi:hypothetical protein